MENDYNSQPWSLTETCREQSGKVELGLILSLNHSHSLALLLGEEPLKLKGAHCRGWGTERMWDSVSLGNRFFMEMRLVEFAFMAFGIDTCVLVHFLLSIYFKISRAKCFIKRCFKLSFRHGKSQGQVS